MTDKKKKKSSLAKKFMKAVLGTAAIVTLAYSSWLGVFYVGRGEKLTAGETALVEGIFGDQIDASKIRKHFRDSSHVTHIFPQASATVLPPLSHIDFFYPYLHAEDFSKENERSYSSFVHETTHCWQDQNFNWSFHKVGVYKYKLRPGTDFEDYGTEQQAEIVSDYAVRWLHPTGSKKQRTADDALLAQIVEKKFPQAKVTRDSLARARRI